VRESIVRQVVQEFNATKEELGPLLESFGKSAVVALVRQHHHTTGEDQGWLFDTLACIAQPSVLIDHPASWVFYGELTETRPHGTGQAMKRVRIYMDPESIDSIEVEVFEGD